MPTSARWRFAAAAAGCPYGEHKTDQTTEDGDADERVGRDVQPRAEIVEGAGSRGVDPGVAGEGNVRGGIEPLPTNPGK